MLAKMFRGSSSPTEATGTAATVLETNELEARPRVLHPFLAGLFPILSVYSHNVYELPLAALIVPVAISLIATSLVWLTLRFWTRDSLRAGLVTSLLVVLCFSYQTIHASLNVTWDDLNALWVVRETHVPSLVVLMVEGFLAIGGYRVIYRRIRRPSGWTSSLNAFALILVALPTVGLVSSKLRETGWTHRNDQPLKSVAKPEAWTPDIYFIVLDGYARADVMKDNYGFDNQPFLDRLERRGFFVAKQSTSNYCQTPLSLASTLNLEYLDRLIEPGSQDLLVLSDMIKKSRVADELHSRGYKSVTFATGFEPTDITESDLYLAPGPGHSAFNDILVGMTPLALLTEHRWIDRFSESRKRTLFVLDRLPSIARIPGPTFTFAHIVSPHPPFLFGENGEDISPRTFIPGPDKTFTTRNLFIGSPEYVRQGYRNQATFLTKRVEQTINRILEQSPEPPVIILQSDHGAWLHYHPNDVEETELRERFGTLNAILIPGKKFEGLTDQAVSVNTFRIVLNNLFGTRMPLLEPPKSYFSTVLLPLELTDVTDRLHSEKERARTFRPPSTYLGLMQQF